MVSSEGEAARPTSQTSRVSEYPASCLPACPTLGAAYGQRMAHVPSLPPTVGARPRPAARGRRDGARGVVRSDDALSRHYDPHRQARIQLGQNGPFRYSRNPGYVALAMIYAGIAVLRNALWAILLLPLVVYVIQREVIEREDRYLERTFGEEYLTYKTRVRRWV
jgi:hypothetical protein